MFTQDVPRQIAVTDTTVTKQFINIKLHNSGTNLIGDALFQFYQPFTLYRPGGWLFAMGDAACGRLRRRFQFSYAELLGEIGFSVDEPVARVAQAGFTG